jgi:hypothetical protein
MTRLTLGQAGRLRSQGGQILRRAQDDGGDGIASLKRVQGRLLK